MKITKHILILAMLAFTISCGKEDTAPSAIDFSLEYGSVPAGTTMKVWTTFRIAATKSDSGEVSDPFFGTVLLPVGASYVPGTSGITYQSSREPDQVGTCPSGQTYLLYNIVAGEFDDSFHFKTYAAAINFKVTLTAAANKGEIGAAAAVAPIADPCNSPTETEATLRVSGS